MKLKEYIRSKGMTVQSFNKLPPEKQEEIRQAHKELHELEQKNTQRDYLEHIEITEE